MTRTIELLKKAREKSAIATGTSSEISGKKLENVNRFRAQNKLSARALKNYKKLADGNAQDVAQAVIDRIEMHQAQIRAALKNNSGISR